MLNFLKKTIKERKPTERTPLEYNDLMYQVGELHGKPLGEFVVSPKLLESTGLKAEDKGGNVLVDETGKLFLVIVDKEYAAIFKPKANKAKSTKFQHRELVEGLTNAGLIAAETPKGYKSAFSLTEVDKSTLPIAPEAAEVITSVYEIKGAELLERFKEKEEVAASESQDAVAPAVETVTEAPASVAAEPEAWD